MRRWDCRLSTTSSSTSNAGRLRRSWTAQGSRSPAQHPKVTVTTRILEGNRNDVIVEEARTWDADLIVLGSHGYGRFRRMMLGSVAGAVVANAPCSVQVAREKRELEGAAA